MKMVTTIGDNSAYDGVISDNATPANGTYAFYFKCSVPREEETYLIYSGSEVVNVNHKNRGMQKGQRVIKWLLSNLVLACGSDYDNLKKACSYWSVNDKLLYFSFKDFDGTEIAQISDDTQSLVTMRIRILKLLKERVPGNANYSCKLTVREYTS